MEWNLECQNGRRRRKVFERAFRKNKSLENKSKFYVARKQANKVVELQTQFFFRNFLGQLHQEPPKWGPKNQFFERLKLGCYFFFDISRYLTDKYFDIVWGYHPPRDPPNGPPKNQFFEWLKLEFYFFDISRYLTHKYFDIVWGLPKWTPRKSIF